MFRAGVMKGLPIGIGYFAISITFGLIAASIGLDIWSATGMSVFVFAGASQFVALELLAAGTGMAELVITTFILNLRHLLMSTVVAERIEGSRPLAMLLSFGITDETFVVSTVPDKENTAPATISPAYLGGIITMAYSCWIGGTIVGSVFGGLIPLSIATSLGVALYAMFIGLLVPSIRRSWRVASIALISAAIAWTLEWGPLPPALDGGWAIIIATIVASALGVLFFAKKGGEQRAA